MSKRVRESVLAEKKGRLLRTKAEMRRSSANLTPLSGSVGDVENALDALKEVSAPPRFPAEPKPFVPPKPVIARPPSPPKVEPAPLRVETKKIEPKAEPPKPVVPAPVAAPAYPFPNTPVVQSPMDVFLSAPVAAPAPPAPPKDVELSSSTPPLGFLSKETVDKVSRAVMPGQAPLPAAEPKVLELPKDISAPREEAKAPNEVSLFEVETGGAKPGEPSHAADDLEGDFFQTEAGSHGVDSHEGSEEEAPFSASLRSNSDEMFAEGSEENPEAAFARQDAARTARMRKIVMGVVAFVGVLAIAGIVKSVVSGSGSSVKSSALTSPSAVVSAVPAMSASAPVASPPVPSQSAQAKPVESVAPDAGAEAAPAVDPAKAAQLEKEALSLLNRGKRTEAIEKAREAIAADPLQAMPYLYLGSALQDSGKWKEGVEAYSECVRKATKGPVHECRAAGGRK